MTRRFVYLLTLLLTLAWGCSDNDAPLPGVDRGLPDAGAADARRAEAGLPDAAPDTTPRVVMPRDESPHSEQMDWWYYTGRLQTASGQTYGFELTVFQPRVLDKFVYVSNFAITDLPQKTFAHDLRATAEDQRDAVAKGFQISVGKDISIAGHGGQDTIRAAMDGYALELSLSATKPMVLQYGTGWMKVGADSPFYYYSYTRMAASGTLTVGGKKQAVTGLAWMDHQWGTIGNGYGWDWFSLRMDDKSDIMLFKVRRKGATGFAGGTLVDAAGKATPLGPGDFTVTKTGEWKSPHTGISYSHGWKLSIPSINAQLTVTPLVKDQEFAKSVFNSPTYWEGICEVSGSSGGKTATGHAYVEITGFVPNLP